MDKAMLLVLEEELLLKYGKEKTHKYLHSGISSRDLVRSFAEDSFSFFCRAFLPEYFTTPFGPMHYEFSNDVELALKSTDGWRGVEVWPRGFGKSTHACTGLGVYNCALRKHPYMLIVKDSYETQAVPEVEAIRDELENNELLNHYFGPFKGRTWGKGAIITIGKWAPGKPHHGGIKIQALGAGMKIRGLKRGPYRPGIVTMDDLENLESVESRPRRDKIRAWHDRSALKAGLKAGQDNCIYLDIGSKIHSDCLIAHLLKRPLYISRFWQAELSLATNQMLWDEWKAVICDLSNENRVEAGRAFFEQRKKEMLVGTEVSWPEGYPYYTLQLIKIGEQKVGESKISSFAAEMQNTPIASEERIFREMHYFDFEDRNGEMWLIPKDWGKAARLSECEMYGACDPSLGGIGSDYSAIIILARSPWGQKFVIVADLERRNPDKIIDDMLRYAHGREIEAFGIESTSFQKILYTDATKAAMEAQDYVPFVPIPAIGNKKARISSLQPDLANGYLLLHKSHTLLNEQLFDFPKGGYDDGPDCLYMVNTIVSMQSGGGIMI